jgi:hypothetical protein
MIVIVVSHPAQQVHVSQACTHATACVEASKAEAFWIIGEDVGQYDFGSFGV